MKIEQGANVYLSDLDKARFGYTIARAREVKCDNLAEILAFCQQNQVEMLIARCSTDDLPTAQAMEREGFELMDTLVYEVFDTKRKPVPADSPAVTIRSFRPEEASQIQEVAGQIFQGYFGHYHADIRLDRQACDDTYLSWAKRSAESRDVADDVLVAVDSDRVVGFVTLKILSATEGEIVVGGVLPETRGKGIYRSFIVGGIQWFYDHQISKTWVSTQINNIAVQKVWARLGFEPEHSFYTFHKWFV